MRSLLFGVSVCCVLFSCLCLSPISVSAQDPYFCCIIPTRDTAPVGDDDTNMLPTKLDKAHCPPVSWCEEYFDGKKPMKSSDGTILKTSGGVELSELSWSEASSLYANMVTKFNLNSPQVKYEIMQKSMHVLGEPVEARKQIDNILKQYPQATPINTLQDIPNTLSGLHRQLSKEIEEEQTLFDKFDKDNKQKGVKPADPATDPARAWLRYAIELRSSLDKWLAAEKQLVMSAQAAKSLVPDKMRTGGQVINDFAQAPRNVPIALMEQQEQEQAMLQHEETHQQHQQHKAALKRRLQHLLSSRVSAATDVEVQARAQVELETEAELATPYQANFLWPRGVVYYQFGSTPSCPNIFTPTLEVDVGPAGPPTTVALRVLVSEFRAQYAKAFFEYQEKTGITFIEYKDAGQEVGTTAQNSIALCAGSAGSFSNGAGYLPSRVINGVVYNNIRMEIHIGRPALPDINTYIHELGHGIGLQHTNQASGDDPLHIKYERAACITAFFTGCYHGNCDVTRNVDGDFLRACGVGVAGFTHNQARAGWAALNGWKQPGVGYPVAPGLGGVAMSDPEKVGCAKYLCAVGWQHQYRPLFVAPAVPNTIKVPGLNYDYYSIMHYPIGPCLTDGRAVTARLPPIVEHEVGHLKLTPSDAVGLRAVYSTKMNTLNPPAPVMLSVAWGPTTVPVRFTTNMFVRDILNYLAQQYGVPHTMLSNMALIQLRTVTGGHVFDPANLVTVPSLTGAQTLGVHDGRILQLFGIAAEIFSGKGGPARGGTLIIIRGHGFGDNRGTVTMGFAGQQAACAVTAWSGTEIRCTSPPAVAGTQFGNAPTPASDLIITHAGPAPPPPARLPYRYAAPLTPTITAVNPARQATGQQITLVGSNLVPTRGSVTIGGVPVTVIASWTDTQITLTVPATVVAAPAVPIVVTTVHGRVTTPFIGLTVA